MWTYGALILMLNVYENDYTCWGSYLYVHEQDVLSLAVTAVTLFLHHVSW